MTEPFENFKGFREILFETLLMKHEVVKGRLRNHLGPEVRHFPTKGSMFLVSGLYRLL